MNDFDKKYIVKAQRKLDHKDVQGFLIKRKYGYCIQQLDDYGRLGYEFVIDETTVKPYLKNE